MRRNLPPPRDAFSFDAVSPDFRSRGDRGRKYGDAVLLSAGDPPEPRGDSAKMPALVSPSAGRAIDSDRRGDSTPTRIRFPWSETEQPRGRSGNWCFLVRAFLSGAPRDFGDSNKTILQFGKRHQSTAGVGSAAVDGARRSVRRRKKKGGTVLLAVDNESLF